MKYETGTIQATALPDNPAGGNYPFWKKAFLVYMAAEVLYAVINFFTDHIMCAKCTAHPAYSISQVCIQLVFTAALWFCLNRFYHYRLWVIIAGNVVMFVGYYFLWILVSYTTLAVAGNWLMGPDEPAVSFRKIIYGSWFEVAKYVLKITAFYVLKFYLDYRRAEQQRIKLALINKEMQLNLLKQQLSPHFYFNTLNNLYGLARSNNSKLSTALPQLSNIMQYVLVDCNKPKVLLKQEISFLESYMALEKLRYEEGTVIELHTEGDTGELTIVPMLLIQFVENAFKHGMKEKTADNWIKVNVATGNNELLFSAINSSGAILSSNGIGISSVKNILSMQYEGRHELHIEEYPGYFSVILKLKLS